MAAQTPFAGLQFMHRLVKISTSSQRYLCRGDILVKLNRQRKDMRTFSSSTVTFKEDDGGKSDSFPLGSKHALPSIRRRPLSPLERISSMLPQDTLSPEVMQLREQDQQDLDDSSNTQKSVTPEDFKHEEVPMSDVSKNHNDGIDALVEPNTSGTQSKAAFNAVKTCLPGESLLVFGEFLVAEYHKQGQLEFRKMFKLETGTRLQSGWGVIMHDDIAGQPAGSFLKTHRGVSLFVRRASLEDYVLLMRRAPAIAYPKDTVTMMMMMDVTEGDCVLESGSGSGAMTLFLSRAVGSRGRVLSVEVREDHQRRAILNYQRWREAWSLRRGEEWPDNVEFHNADLSTASSLLSGQGFHSVALDLTNPQLVLSTVFPHLHTGAICALYLANITQVTDLLEGLRCLKLPVLCESIIEVPIREWLVTAALQKNGQYCRRKPPILTKDERQEDETSENTYTEETSTDEQPAFGSVPYIARPHPIQKSHSAFLVKLRKCAQ